MKSVYVDACMGREASIDSMRTLEKPIDSEEGNGGAIKFKRARNSLLNVSTRVAPEALKVWNPGVHIHLETCSASGSLGVYSAHRGVEEGLL